MKYKYKGRGERVVTAEDFESLGVEHNDVYFTEDNGCVQELTDEAAQALINTGELLEVQDKDEAEETSVEDPTVEEVVDDNEKIVDKELAEDEIDKAKTRSSRKKT